MTLRRLIFRDFWRKLVALIFAVIIYWQVSESIKRNGAGTKSQKTEAGGTMRSIIQS